LGVTATRSAVSIGTHHADISVARSLREIPAHVGTAPSRGWARSLRSVAVLAIPMTTLAIPIERG
jgi:hypothetical protein